MKFGLVIYPYTSKHLLRRYLVGYSDPFFCVSPGWKCSSFHPGLPIFPPEICGFQRSLETLKAFTSGGVRLGLLTRVMTGRLGSWLICGCECVVHDDVILQHRKFLEEYETGWNKNCHLEMCHMLPPCSTEQVFKHIFSYSEMGRNWTCQVHSSWIFSEKSRHWKSQEVRSWLSSKESPIR